MKDRVIVSSLVSGAVALLIQGDATQQSTRMYQALSYFSVYREGTSEKLINQ